MDNTFKVEIIRKNLYQQITGEFISSMYVFKHSTVTRFKLYMKRCR